MRWRISVAGVLLVGAASMFWWMQPDEPIEPIYRGKALGVWLNDRPNGGWSLSPEAEEAVRTIGPAAVPTLMNWMSRADSPMVGWSQRLGGWLGTHRFTLSSCQDARTRAVYGCRVLGPAARSAFPALANLILRSKDETQNGDAINCLVQADAETMRRLAVGLKSPDAATRGRVIFAFCCLRIAADEVCLPALEGLSNDTDPAIRQSAVKAVAFITQQMVACVPLLADPNPKTRAAAAQMIGRYRARARAFLPNLEAARADADPTVRAAVGEAIQQVRGE